MTIGRKMDEAWKKAISEGKKKLGIGDNSKYKAAGAAIGGTALLGALALANRKKAVGTVGKAIVNTVSPSGKGSVSSKLSFSPKLLDNKMSTGKALVNKAVNSAPVDKAKAAVNKAAEAKVRAKMSAEAAAKAAKKFADDVSDDMRRKIASGEKRIYDHSEFKAFEAETKKKIEQRRKQAKAMFKGRSK